MYQIFINEKCLIITPRRTSLNSDKHFVVNYSGSESLLSVIELLEQNNEFDSAEIVGNDTKLIYEKFCSFYKIIEASGGLVINENMHFLMIYRLDKWDLPKGKIEKGEKKKEAALREVEEECGITNLTIHNKLTTTYHTYYLKNKRVLKISFWYLMTTTYKGQLIPQIEENITEVRWADATEMPLLLVNSYPAIKLVYETYFKQKNELQKQY